MTLVEYVDRAGLRLGVVVDGQVVDAAEAEPGIPARMLALIQAGTSALDLLRSAVARNTGRAMRGALEALDLGPPLPDAPKLLCVAGNYSEHIRESGFMTPEPGQKITPQFFSKFPSTCITGPGAAISRGPRSVAMDWELELAVIIGRRGRSIPVESALDFVFGYSIVNDLSERKMNSNIPNRHLRTNDAFFDWLNGKWFDGYAPLGPGIVTADEIPDPQALGMELDVNGEVMQCSTTANMIFSVAELIAYISGFVTLEPGDIIATGTPEGTGMSRGRFLRPGDNVRCRIDRLGTLEHHIVK